MYKYYYEISGKKSVKPAKKKREIKSFAPFWVAASFVLTIGALIFGLI